jgi:hypothetical protein
MVRPQIIYVIRVDDVPKSFTIKHILLGIKVEIKSLVGIFRECDPINHRIGQNVFLLLHKRDEFEELIDRDVVTVWGVDYAIVYNGYNSEWNASSVILPKAIFERIFDRVHPTPGVPTNVKISNLRKCSFVTTFYLIAILRAECFKQVEHNIVGITLLYNTKANKLRDFGYITFNDHATALQFQQVEFDVFDNKITAIVGNNFPLIATVANLDTAYQLYPDIRGYDHVPVDLINMNCLTLLVPEPLALPVPEEPELTETEENNLLASSSDEDVLDLATDENI